MRRGARGTPRRRGPRPACSPLALVVNQSSKVGDDARASSWGPGDAVRRARLPATQAARTVGGGGGAVCWAAAGPKARLGRLGGWRPAK
jgi:hypothetical protein